MSENTKTIEEQNKKADEPIIREQIMNELWENALTAHAVHGDDSLMQALFRAMRDMGMSTNEIDEKANWYAEQFIKMCLA